MQEIRNSIANALLIHLFSLTHPDDSCDCYRCICTCVVITDRTPLPSPTANHRVPTVTESPPWINPGIIPDMGSADERRRYYVRCLALAEPIPGMIPAIDMSASQSHNWPHYLAITKSRSLQNLACQFGTVSLPHRPVVLFSPKVPSSLYRAANITTIILTERRAGDKQWFLYPFQQRWLLSHCNIILKGSNTQANHL